MSFLQRLWQRMRRPRGFVGRDLEGNSYFEYPNPNDVRPKRVVKYGEGRDMWTYIAGDKRLAVQWTSWLSHTRIHPPSLDELTSDIERQNRLRLKVALIEARDREQRLRVAASTPSPNLTSEPVSTTDASATQHQVPFAQSTAQPDGQKAENRTQGPGASPIIPQEAPPVPSSELQHARRPPTNDEPEAWIPRAVQRGA
ncbi:hypothetical protein PsYK624_015810 [Phanerochaete sordida]|uniref:NADH dehydrogenase [ubiquinone] 1 alpha subcomplex subunit n=1 Tax=Phanerochaete sordida TaxID=48140 RepID=A0A9P3FZS1_9APHY|nr:hypothetical protein PsYK624_015810 [Phanerochaete sordida]